MIISVTFYAGNESLYIFSFFFFSLLIFLFKTLIHSPSVTTVEREIP